MVYKTVPKNFEDFFTHLKKDIAQPESAHDKAKTIWKKSYRLTKKSLESILSKSKTCFYIINQNFYHMRDYGCKYCSSKFSRVLFRNPKKS